MQNENPTRNRLTDFFSYFTIYDTIAAFYVAAFIMSPMLSAAKDIVILGMPIAAGHMFSIISLSVMAVMQNNYGKDAAKKLVVSGVIARVLIYFLVLLLFFLPGSVLHGYERLFKSSGWMLAGTMFSRMFGAFVVDIPLFHKLKNMGTSFWANFIATNMIEHVVTGFSGLFFVYMAKPELFHTFNDFVLRYSGSMFARFFGVILLVIPTSLINKYIQGRLCKS
jgi:uncharacterized PurR-regulated membrane protein YhhQ (DUF165 family)